MDQHIHSRQLPGSDSSPEFEGKVYGAGLTVILANVEAGTGRPSPQAAEVGAPFGVLSGPVS